MDLPPLSEPIECWHCLFSGEVQGVGFRRHTERFATELGLTGWVRNLPDGRVEMIAQGAADDLRRLLEKLENRFNILQAECERQPESHLFESFCIRR